MAYYKREAINRLLQTGRLVSLYSVQLDVPSMHHSFIRVIRCTHHQLDVLRAIRLAGVQTLVWQEDSKQS